MNATRTAAYIDMDRTPTIKPGDWFLVNGSAAMAIDPLGRDWIGCRTLDNETQHITRLALLAARRIVTVHDYPPIPIRTMDWSAYFDGEEENGGYGYGRTEAEAVADFINNLDE